MTSVQNVSRMTKINIGFIWYPVTTLGYGKRIGVWFQGCSKRCENCISPEFQLLNGGTTYAVEEIVNSICDKQEIDGLTISGGEPFDQPEGLLKLIMTYKEKFNDDILIFTGYALDELHEKKSFVIEEILRNIAVLIDGRYMDDKNNGIGLRGSTNQKINVWKYNERYSNADKSNRKIQCVLMNDRLRIIGIPPK